MTAQPQAPDVPPTVGADVPPLVVRELTVRFGGLTAVDHVSFTVRPGTVHALIGPNGAGKSTCFNAISGVYRATSGQILLGEQDLVGVPAHRRARLGIGRAFQNLALSPASTVLDNVLLGRYALGRGGFLATGLRMPWVVRDERRQAERAVEICDFLGIAAHLHTAAGVLPYGDQKRVDIARALAVEPTVLMLDEPAAGMNAAETAQIARTIRDVRDALGISVLLVEHDMELVMGIADRVTVLDFGRLIADDTPRRVQHDAEVIRAYLGADEDGAGAPPRHAAQDHKPDRGLRRRWLPGGAGTGGPGARAQGGPRRGGAHRSRAEADLGGPGGAGRDGAGREDVGRDGAGRDSTDWSGVDRDGGPGPGRPAGGAQPGGGPAGGAPGDEGGEVR
jgi:branched-chain amino acid transport system ATP-binding protein